MGTMGIVRKVDDLGRIVLPKELRMTMDIRDKDSLEISVEGDKIILKKYEPSCAFCASKENIIKFKDHYICKDCLAELKGKE